MKVTIAQVITMLFLPQQVISAFSPSNRKSIATKSVVELGAAFAPSHKDNRKDRMPNIFDALWHNSKKKTACSFKSEPVVIDPDFTLTWWFLAAGVGIYFQNIDPTFFSAPAGTVSIGSAGLFPTIAAFLHLWFGTFLADRAVRLRCVFTDDRFLIMDRFNAKTGTKLPEGKLTERRKNFAVGGPDGWTYDHFINWDFFPNVHLPVLVYFKEDQTPKSKWNVGPGEYDKRNDGMVHFFPAFGNSFQLKREFELRGLSKTNPQRD